MFFENGSLSIGRIFGIRISIHWLFFLAALWRIQQWESFGYGFGASIVVSLFLIVLLHEFGHCFACRSVKGQADHIVLWPLGGLAFCNPPQRPFPQLVTTVGGPMVNVLLVPALWALCRFVIFPYALAHLGDPVYDHMNDLLLMYGIVLKEMNWTLLVFNLLPIYPMDGGRITQELLWFVVGYQRSLNISGMIGIVGGACFVLLGAHVLPHAITIPGADLTFGDTYDPFLIMIGIMAIFASWGIYKRSQEMSHWKKT